jgi:hypothetical protein
MDRPFFWTTAGLEAKLLDFQHFCNGYRTDAGLKGQPPGQMVDGPASRVDFASYGWHCRGLYQTPIATCYYEFPRSREEFREVSIDPTNLCRSAPGGPRQSVDRTRAL